MKQSELADLRKIAKLFAKGLPVEGVEFGETVERYLSELRALPKQNRMWLTSAYIFASKSPREEREDLLQEFYLALLELRPQDEKLAYTIVRQDWRNWWTKFRTRSHYLNGSLNETVHDGQGNECELGELLVGEVEFEYKYCLRADCRKLLNAMPEGIKALVTKRLEGRGLSKSERWSLDRWVNRNWQEVLA